MPNRIIRDGILDSERVNRLDDEEEVFYRRLMSLVDDYGRFEARRSLLRARLYPLKLDTKNEQRIGDLLLACVRERLLFLYQAEGKTYLQLLDFRQQERSASKYPEPPAKLLKSFASHLLSPADAQRMLSDAQQMLAGAHLGVFVFVSEGVAVGEGERGAGSASAEQRSPKASPPPTFGRKPHDFEAVASYAAQIGLPESDARTFFDRYTAKGWKTGRTPLADWGAELRVWQQRGAEHLSGRTEKISRDGGGVDSEPFNPDRPDAHTGGLPIAGV